MILASQSPRRKQLLQEAGYRDFDIIPSRVEEIDSTPENWFCVALLNAEKKADDIAAKYPDALVIGADTVVEFEQQAVGKPSTLAEAFQMIKGFSGKSHVVSTGVCIRCAALDLTIRFTEHSKVFFRELSDEDIQYYLTLVPVLDKAGAYGIQDHGDLLIDHIEGSFSNIMGFPVERFAEAMMAVEKIENP